MSTVNPVLSGALEVVDNCKHCKKSVKTPWVCTSCPSAFHPSCARQAKVVKQGENSKEFVSCCQTADNKVKVGEMDEKRIKSIFADLFKEFFAPFKKAVEREFGELKKSVQYISDCFDEQKVVIEKLATDTKQLGEENKLLKLQITELERRMDDVEQREKDTNIIISGIPRQQGNDTKHTVLQIARAMDLRLDNNSICEAYRLGKQDKAPLLVKLQNKEQKSMFFRKIKEMKGLRPETCGMQGQNNIYINEDLTQKNQKLFKKAMHFKHLHQFHSIFTRNGRIFLKKTPTGDPIKIARVEDLRNE